MKHLIDIKDITVKEIDELIEVAKDIIANPEKYSEKCKGKILATSINSSISFTVKSFISIKCFIFILLLLIFYIIY